MRFLLYISIVFCVSFTWSQSAYVLLEVSNLQPKVGEYITVQMSSNVGSNFDMNFPDEFQSGMNVMSGMRQEYINGRSNTVYYQSLSGFFMEPGSYVFGPVMVKTNKKSYKSNKLRVVVKGDRETSKEQKKSTRPKSTKKPPIFAETRLSKSKIYRGEPIYLQSSVFSKKEFSSIRNYNPYKIDAKHDAFKINASKELDWVSVAVPFAFKFLAISSNSASTTAPKSPITKAISSTFCTQTRVISSTSLRTIGLPAIGTKGFGTVNVWGLKREPLPAIGTIIFICYFYI